MNSDLKGSTGTASIERLPLRGTLDPNIARQLRYVCNLDDATSLSRYLDSALLLHGQIWQRSVWKLEQAGWSGSDVLAAHHALLNVRSLETCEDWGLSLELQMNGQTALSRRVTGKPLVAGYLVAVLFELRAGNPACASAVSRMLSTPTESRLQRTWRGSCALTRRIFAAVLR